MESANTSPALQYNMTNSTSSMQAAAVVQESGQSQTDLMSDYITGGWESQAIDDNKSLTCDDDDYNGLLC